MTSSGKQAGVTMARQPCEADECGQSHPTIAIRRTEIIRWLESLPALCRVSSCQPTDCHPEDNQLQHTELTTVSITGFESEYECDTQSQARPCEHIQEGEIDVAVEERNIIR